MGHLLTALLTIVIHDTAGVEPETMTRARAQIEQILANAGVSPRWMEMNTGRMFSVHVIIRRQPAKGPGSSSPSALGTTLGGDHSTGGTSFIFYDRVLGFAHSHSRDVATILAYAVVHELGHVLLPAPAHAERGVMKAEWSEDDLRSFAGGLRFSLSEAAAIRATLSLFAFTTENGRFEDEVGQ